MGIRIHKSIGYGLNNIKTDDKGIADGRFSDHDWMHDIYDSKFEDGFKQFLENKDQCVQVLIDEFAQDPDRASWRYSDIELSLSLIRERNKKNIWNYNFFDYDGEGPGDWILFYPMGHTSGHNSWARYDDTIDYYENRVYKKELESIIVDLMEYGTLGLFPYNHGMHLKPNRENKIKKAMPKYFEINPDRSNYIEGGHYNMLIGMWDEKQEPLIKDPILIKHLKEDWHPVIPTSIMLFVYYFKVFKNPYTVFDLKPLICQWWS